MLCSLFLIQIAVAYSWLRLYAPRGKFPLTSNHRRISLAVKGSTVISPKKPGINPSPADPAVEESPIGVPNIFKESRDIEKEFNEFRPDEDKHYVILYNDPINKRIYVAMCLMEVFGWTEDEATEVMLTAHNYGFAILGEWALKLAQEYCRKLVDKGLYAEVRNTKDMSQTDS